MKIYLCHASSFDYHNELYQPIKTSSLWPQHQFIFPHALHEKPSSSKDIISDCDLVIAEVSVPSTGLGIELGWAEVSGRSILCLYKKGMCVSSSLPIICKHFVEYESADEMVKGVAVCLGNFQHR